MDTLNNYNQSAEENLSLSDAVTGFMTKVYGWMSIALFITAITAVIVANSSIIEYFKYNPRLLFGLLIGEFALVFIITGAIKKLSLQATIALFILYSLANGFTLSIVFLMYTPESIASTFAVTGLTFGAMSLYGLLTKKDLSGWGNLLFMALIGLIIASVVNWFLASSTLYWILTYAGVIIFVGLTAYDTQKLKRLSAQIGEGEHAGKMAILGALTLYLDFINLFLYLLRLLGKRR